MSCGICGIQGNRVPDYVEYNMDFSNQIFEMFNTAEKIAAFALAGAFCVIAPLELVFKNGAFLLYNAVVFIIRCVYCVVSKTIEVVSSIFTATYSVVNPNNSLFQDNNVPQGGLQLIGTRFSAEDLITFNSALRLSTSPQNRKEVFLEHFVYSLWYDPQTEAVNIQDMNRPDRPLLSLKIAQGGQVLSIQLDGVEQAAFPADFEVCMYPCFMKSLEVSSSYILDRDLINIKVIRRGLREVPEHHLKQFGELLSLTDRTPNLHVQFLTNTIDRDQGIDAGGPRRDWMDDLVGGLILNKGELRFENGPDTTMKMPVNVTPFAGDRLSDLSIEDKEGYEALGALMMLSYNSEESLLIGRRFEDALFKAAFCLSPIEIDTEFQNLGLPTLIKMCKSILESRGANLRIAILLEARELNEQDWAEAAAIAEMSEGWPENFEFDSTNIEHKNLVLAALRKMLLSQIGKYLAPIHAIARGIRLTSRRWNTQINHLRAQDFSDTVQGRLNGAAIANSIVLNEGYEINQHIRDQKSWIQEWLRDPQTSQDEIREFVKFATGSTSLAQNGQIRITSQYNQPYLPVPVAHACFSTIDLAPQRCDYGRHNNHNKESFILAMRELALTQAGNYFMG